MRKETNTTYIHIHDHIYIPGEGGVWCMQVMALMTFLYCVIQNLIP